MPHPVQPLSTLRTPRCRDARKTRSRPACSALNGPDFHWQAHSSFLSHPAPGSCRRSDVIASRAFQCRPVTSIRARRASGHADPGSVPGACLAVLASSGRAPSLHALRRRSSRLCSGASSVLRARPTPHPFPDRLRIWLAVAVRDRLSDCGPDEVSQVPTDPFARDGVFDHGRASTPRIAAPHILPSAK